MVAAIDPVGKPRADSDNTIWFTPVSRLCRFFTIVGENEASRSRGTSISTGTVGPPRHALETDPFVIE
jgi:hypothetical protein